MHMQAKSIKNIEKTVNYGIVLITAVILFLILMNIFFRLVGVSPIFWVEEIVRLIFIWICALGIVSGISTHDHMKLEVFNRFKLLGGFLHRLSWFLFSFFFILLAYSGFLAVETNIVMGRTLKTLPILPFWLFSIVLPICFLLRVFVTFIFFLPEK